MITPPLTPPIAGFEEMLGCSIFSTPPSPKIWSVHGSMYDRDGGCMSARKASKNSISQTWISSWRTCLEARGNLPDNFSIHNHPALNFLLESQIRLSRFIRQMIPVDTDFRSAAEAQVTSGPWVIDCLPPSTSIKSSGIPFHTELLRKLLLSSCTAAHFNLNRASFGVPADNKQPPRPQKFGIDFWMRASTFPMFFKKTPWLIHSHPHHTRETKIKPMAADQETKSHESMAEAKDTGLRRDSTFYQDAVVFRVEGTLFKVPRRGFESGSEVFATMFTLPSVLGGAKEGQTAETPIILEGIKEDDFRSLLHLMYPIGPGDPDVPRNGLISALHLATMWDLKDVHPSLRHCKNRIDASAPEFRRKSHPGKTRNGAQLVAEWATDKLDWETTARLFFVQKQILGNPEVCSGNHAKNCYYCGRNNQSVCCIQNANREVCKVHELLREVFEGELRGMEVVETT
ncbi:hypothetical protein K443DRAFT_130215 [Laccaria amethystina LaAM-08-1]|uniref:BTB domain-containing protein n=1 Tax=Laccaria amethystina LaAM-08-1 TaxID=1095629 RepID=A0A0C9X130_9AGAR|nr:hypothetical protein K443DRAFT_130215 [Laccaria amethystina LaAM-08-1]